MEASRSKLAESAKRVDARRREAMRQSEHQLVRVQALERELERQLGISDEQRRRVSEAGLALYPGSDSTHVLRWSERRLCASCDGGAAYRARFP